jgi:hypothetical protein
VIISDRSTLAVYNQNLTVADISAALGMETHGSADIGDPTRAALAGRALGVDYMTHMRASWSFDIDWSETDAGDGVASLRALVDVFREKADALRSLRLECETVIWWSGSSDSSRGTFIVPSSLLADLAVLGCELRGTAFLAEPSRPR